MSEDVIVLNKGLDSRTTKSGKQRFHIKIESEALAFDLSTRTLAQPIAEALAHHYREKIRGITATASAATIKAREAAGRALARGESWAVKRYGGGKMGTRQPGQSDRLFNDSGRFAESIVASAAKDGTFRVNVAANRLDPSTLNGGQGALDRIWSRLVQLVPSIQDVSIAMASDEMLRAQTRAAQRMIIKMKKSSGEGVMGVAKALIDLGRTARDVLERAAG